MQILRQDTRLTIAPSVQVDEFETTASLPATTNAAIAHDPEETASHGDCVDHRKIVAVDDRHCIVQGIGQLIATIGLIEAIRPGVDGNSSGDLSHGYTPDNGRSPIAILNDNQETVANTRDNGVNSSSHAIHGDQIPKA